MVGQKRPLISYLWPYFWIISFEGREKERRAKQGRDNDGRRKAERLAETQEKAKECPSQRNVTVGGVWKIQQTNPNICSSTYWFLSLIVLSGTAVSVAVREIIDNIIVW